MSSKNKNSENKEKLSELLASLNFQEASNIWTRNYVSSPSPQKVKNSTPMV